MNILALPKSKRSYLKWFFLGLKWISFNAAPFPCFMMASTKGVNHVSVYRWRRIITIEQYG